MNQKMKDILRPTIKELRDMIFMLRKNALTMAAVIVAACLVYNFVKAYTKKK